VLSIGIQSDHGLAAAPQGFGEPGSQGGSFALVGHLGQDLGTGAFCVFSGVIGGPVVDHDNAQVVQC
jgi:hypothetical protein